MSYLLLSTRSARVVIQLLSWRSANVVIQLLPWRSASVVIDLLFETINERCHKTTVRDDQRALCNITTVWDDQQTLSYNYCLGRSASAVMDLLSGTISERWDDQQVANSCKFSLATNRTQCRTGTRGWWVALTTPWPTALMSMRLMKAVQISLYSNMYYVIHFDLSDMPGCWVPVWQFQVHQLQFGLRRSWWLWRRNRWALML